jgi:hypothetical protein
MWEGKIRIKVRKRWKKTVGKRENDRKIKGAKN